MNSLTVTAAEIRKYAVKAEGNDAVFRNAEEILKRYVGKILGSEFSEGCDGDRFFVLSIDKNLPSAHYDGFVIEPQGKNVRICGKTERALIYAVYEFAERFLGAKFLTADCEILPSKTEITVTEYSYEPLFEMRTYLIGDTFGKTANQEHMAKTKVKDVFTPAEQAFGGPAQVYGRNVCHNFHHYVPFEKYGKSHPEFYREIDVVWEKQVTVDITNGLTDDGTIDETIEESVVKSVVSEMYEDVKARPDVSVFVLTQEDGPVYYDNERNRQLAAKYKRSGLLIRFCNAVVREVNRLAQKELGRTVKLSTFAYDYTKDAPVKYENGEILPIDDTVIADENLIVQFALFSNAAYDYFSPCQNEGVLKPMKEWRVVAKEFWFWAYDIAFNNYLAFYDSFKNIDANIKGFREYGLRYLCMQGCQDSRKNWQCNARSYAYRQLMNGSPLSAEELLDEYFAGYYSVAADSVKEFIGIFENNYAKLKADGKDVRFETFGNFSNGENNPYSMLCESIAAIERGEEKISEAYDGAERERYLKRLAAVKLTAYDLIYLNYRYYFPACSEEERVAAREKFIAVANYAELDDARENYTLKQYVDFTESEVRKEIEGAESAV